MRTRLLPLLTFAVVTLPFVVACGGTEEPNPTGGTGGKGGGSAGTGGSGAGTGGTAGTGTAGTGGSAGGGGTAGTGMAGTGGAMGGAGTGGGAGTAGGPSGGSGGGGSTDSPSDTSQAGIEAFLTAMSHHGSDWRAGSEMPVDGTSIHGRDRIWYNRTLRQSAADGKGGSGMPHVAGSMVVKDIYTADAVIGRAVMLRNSTNQWIYYCMASEAGRCNSTSMPNQASYATAPTACSCHGAGTIVTGDMIPAP
jgi:hypothetical protein